MEKDTTRGLAEERVREIVREVLGAAVLPQAEASGSSQDSGTPQELPCTTPAKTDLQFLDFLNQARAQGNTPMEQVY